MCENHGLTDCKNRCSLIYVTVPIGHTMVVVQISEVSKSLRTVTSHRITCPRFLGNYLMRDQVKDRVRVGAG